MQSKAPISDCRKAALTKQNRPCLTPWGQFRSVQLAVEHVMKHEVEFMLPFVTRYVNARPWEAIDTSDLKQGVARNIYATVYARCRTGSLTDNGDFRLL